MINALHLLWIVPLSVVAGAVLLMAVVAAVLDYCDAQERKGDDYYGKN